MKLLLDISLILNIIIICCEILILKKVKKKINIIKYYTFLQNFLALIVSCIFSVYLIIAIFSNRTIPEFIKGLRYVVTCGLTATMFIYLIFLSSKSKNVMGEEDFKSNLNPKIANFILHYFVPIISLLSFLVFERQISLNQPKWTGFAAIPSCLYWIIYAILSTTNLWEEPYDLTLTKRKGIKGKYLLDILVMITIPLSFVLISYILWNIK